MQVGRTPITISSFINDLCHELVRDPKPEFISVIPQPGIDLLDCFAAVGRRTEQDGGSVCYGWQIWEWPDVMIEAEFHAVWRDAVGRLHDITPKQIPIDMILFLPDPERKYEGRQVNNVRRALRSDPLILAWFKCCDAEFELLNRGERAYQVGEIELSPEEADELEQIRKRKLEFELQFSQTSKPSKQPQRFSHVGRNDPCPCGSGKKFKKCCGL
jgi:hypothetical protein